MEKSGFHKILRSSVYNQSPKSLGFTLIEILIVAPIVILVIGVFIAAIVNMTGEVLSARANNSLAYNIQDALSLIKQDVELSSSFLATNNITITSPQGYNDATTAFRNADASNGTMLILNTYTTTENPSNLTRNIVYLSSQPNLCGSELVNQNQPLMMNVVYFVKSNTLWRRVIAPSNFATIGCDIPWQQPSCAPGISGAICIGQDMRLVDGVDPSGFVVNYYPSLDSRVANTISNDTTKSDALRLVALQTNNTVEITINATATIAGRDISQSGTIRSAITSNSNIMTTQGPLIPRTTVDDSTIGTIPWSNPNNSQISDNLYATTIVNSSTSHFLKATNFGFSIPSEAIIKGIVVGVEANVAYNGSSWVLDYIRIVKNGIIQEANRTLNGYPATDTTISSSSSTDLWGTTWTAEDINNTNFGVAISTIDSKVQNSFISIDNILITINYTLPSNQQSESRPSLLWKQIDSNELNTCGIASNSISYCWGSNDNGQLGNNSLIQSLVPVPVNRTGVLSGLTIKSITVGGNHTCAIASDDLAYCWGYNNHGQLGNNSNSQSIIPVAVNRAGALNGLTIKSISARGSNTCAIASNNLAYCWGYNLNGQLGNNSNTESWVPVAVTTAGILSGKTFKSIAAGDYRTCAIASDDLAYCWGANGQGELGNNSDSTSWVPVAVDTTGVLNGKTFKSIVTSYDHTCAIASDDLAYCWGTGDYGKLGNNTYDPSYVAVPVYTDGFLIDKTIDSISAGLNHTCVVASNGLAYCWGANYDGQFGNNTTGNSSSIPMAVTATGVLNGKTLKSISGGGGHSCAIANDDLVYCWGYNGRGQLGNNAINDSLVPVSVVPIYY